MSLLRLRVPLADAPEQCQWVLIGDDHEAIAGDGPLSQLPQGAARVQLVLPATQVFIARTHLPKAAGRPGSPVLSYALEDQTLGDPEDSQVCWLGRTGGDAGDADVLAAVNRHHLGLWLEALDAVGARAPEIHCESLLLPRKEGEWSLAWDGREGILRTGELEAAATDCGEPGSPPLSLRLLLEQARSQGETPTAIALYSTTPADRAPGPAPDLDAWQRDLGVPLRVAGTWDWRTAPSGHGVVLFPQRRRWRLPAVARARLRPAAWMLGMALAIHALALSGDWMLLAREQKNLRQNMEARFRAVVPDALAVVDPELQLRRKLSLARQAAGQTDGSDFLPMIGQVADAVKDLPAGAVRAISYEGGRMTLEIKRSDEALMRRVISRLGEAGLAVDSSQAAQEATMVLTLRAL